jgi:hypothetical protein
MVCSLLALFLAIAGASKQCKSFNVHSQVGSNYMHSWQERVTHSTLRSLDITNNLRRQRSFPSYIFGTSNSSEDDYNTSISVSTDLPEDESLWKTEGERIIQEAAVKCGANKENVSIRWVPGKIIVTLSGETYLQAKEEDEMVASYIEYDDETEQQLDDFEDFDQEIEVTPIGGIDVVSVAKAINMALGEKGEGSLAYNIAFHHEIEVTTPGASDELKGIMFESYKGFDVLVESMDPKVKDKVIIVEGKLVERNEEHTIINVKGRVRKFSNELVQSVKLPKAKREKGVK